LALTALILSACGGGAESGDAQQTGGGDGDDTSLSSVSAEDKGTLEYGTPATGSVANGAAHSYQFTGASGENILVRIEATGSTFYSPYVFLYGPDDVLIANMDTEQSNRSKRLEQALTADGTYSIVVQPVNDIGAGGYSVRVELQTE
jgi:hypothetical protein